MPRKASKKKAGKAKRILVPRTRGSGTMTEAQYWGFVRAGLRSKTQTWPPRLKVLEKAKKRVYGKKHKYEYKCSICKKYYKKETSTTVGHRMYRGKKKAITKKHYHIEVDHILECGSLKCAEDLPRFVERLFCEEDNLQVVCETCHAKKTRKTNNEKTKENKSG